MTGCDARDEFLRSPIARPRKASIRFHVAPSVEINGLQRR